ncbi:hypothetical protein CHS0354_041085 [Potamilus streckersoni]|uniref:Uncharacterized protein n=1 Tax=Potamilus streckersoni TaxID=2493646 RepID=A0AAE0VUV5_9BIVA|nr:hypothetical protein CHS0354_041085 [Potamilus streckersoni]
MLDAFVDPELLSPKSVQHSLALRGFADKANELHLPGFGIRVFLLLDLLPTKANKTSLPTQLYFTVGEEEF